MQIAPAMTGPGQARTSSLMSGHSGAGAGSAAQIEGHCHGSGAGHAQWTAGQSVGPLARWFAKWMPVRTSSCTIHRAAARRWSMHSEHSAAEGGWSRCDNAQRQLNFGPRQLQRNLRVPLLMCMSRHLPFDIIHVHAQP